MVILGNQCSVFVRTSYIGLIAQDHNAHIKLVGFLFLNQGMLEPNDSVNNQLGMCDLYEEGITSYATGQATR